MLSRFQIHADDVDLASLHTKLEQVCWPNQLDDGAGVSARISNP
jgi:hypothetical protein